MQETTPDTKNSTRTTSKGETMETNGNDTAKTTNASTQTQKDVNKVSTLGESAQALVKAYKSMKESKGAETTGPDAQIDKEIYMTIEQAAEILKRSVYRVRQMYWEDKLGVGIKGAKKVYLLRKNVLDAKNSMESRKSKDSGVEQRRLGKRINLACETVTMLLNSDKSVKEPQKAEIMALVAKYAKIGNELVSK